MRCKGIAMSKGIGKRKHWHFRAPYATLLIALTVLVVYLKLSEGGLFIQTDAFYSYAFGLLEAPWNIANYLFVHTGPRHLALNLTFLVAWGMVAEQALKRKDVAAIFVVSGMVAGLAYSLMTPDTLLVGSSTGVYGLFGASMLARPRETLIAAAAAFLVTSQFLLPALDSLEEKNLTGLEQSMAAAAAEKEALSKQVNALKAAQSTALEELVRLQVKRQQLVEQGQDTSGVDEEIKTVEARIRATEEEKALASTAVGEKEKQAQALEEKTQVYKIGKTREIEAPIAITSHSVATLAGSVYVYFLRRNRVAKLEWLDPLFKKLGLPRKL